MRAEVGERTTRSGTAGGNLALATAAFALTFWAWNLIGPLSRSYSEDLGLTPTQTQTSVLVAVVALIVALYTSRAFRDVT